MGEKIMKRSITLSAGAAVLIFISLLTTSCSETTVRQTSGKKMPGNGPPAHAPAHGRRAKEAGEIKIVYDSERDIYIVIGIPQHYYFEGHYYRLRHRNWQMSTAIDGKWKTIKTKQLPPGLQVKKDKQVSKNARNNKYGK
jgi:hypothetical protein